MANMATSALRAEDTRELDDLDRFYGHAYDLAATPERWIANELSTGRWFVASCAADLRRLLAASVAKA
jgi:hypothetical protein